MPGMTGWAGVSSPKRRPKAACSPGSRNWPGKKMTLEVSRALRMATTTSSSSSCLRSRPRISAPMVPDSGVISRATAGGVTVIVGSFGEEGLRGGGGQGGVVVEQTAPSQPRQDPFAEPVGLFKVGLAGEDEVVEAELVVLGDAVADLVVAADQGGSGAAADEAEAGPQVGSDDEAVAVTPV